MSTSQVPRKNRVKSPRAKLRQRTAKLRQQINKLDYVVSGTLHTRTKTCGRSYCRCREDPEARHGPYFEWSRRQDGKLVHSIVSEQQAKQLEQAINNHRKILALLKAWERESAQAILNPEGQEAS